MGGMSLTGRFEDGDVETERWMLGADNFWLRKEQIVRGFLAGGCF